MISGKTTSGFEFNINETVMNDMEIVDALASAETGNVLEKASAVSVICKKVLGDKRKELYDHVRTDDGRVPPEAIEREMLEIFNAFGDQGKN